MRHNNRVVAVTGAARGMGKAIAVGFAREGADVALCDIGDAEPAADEIRSLGRRALTVKADVADYDQMEDFVAQTGRELGRLDVFVGNAAYSDRDLFIEADLDCFRKTVDVTMWGQFNGLRAACRYMVRQGEGGQYIAVSSPHAIFPVKYAMAYNMAKAAVDQMIRTAVVELYDDRIRCNIIHPGWIDTPGERKYYTEQQIEEMGPTLPWKRLGKPEEIADLVLFVASDKADYINGATLTADGGLQHSFQW